MILIKNTIFPTNCNSIMPRHHLSRIYHSQMHQTTHRYRTDQFGLQDARLGVRFVRFPPVLRLRLKRFEPYPFQHQGLDPNQEMVHINDRFEFPTTLDLSAFLDRSIPEAAGAAAPIYMLQSVLTHAGDSRDGGRHCAFVRPSAADNRYALLISYNLMLV